MNPSRASQKLLNLEAEDFGRLLASALGPDAAAPEGGGGRHLEAELLARHALLPEELSREERERCGAHLKACADCRQDAELTRAAVLAARSDGPESRPQPAGKVLSFAVSRPAVRAAQRVALAAGLILAAGSALFVGLSLQEPGQEVLRGADLDGVETMTVDAPILVDHTTLHRGAQVALEGAEVVGFGEGFSVAEGASLTVSTIAFDNDEASG